MKSRIAVSGSLAFDYIMDYQGIFSDNIMPDKIHKINLSFLLDTLKKERGGTAGNIAYNLALLGADTTILASAGNDFSDYKNFLDQAGVDISNIQIIADLPSACAFIMTDQMDNQITGFYPGAMLKSDDLSLKSLKTKADFVVISPSSPELITRLANEARELKIPFMVDIGMQLPTLSLEQIKQILAGAKILIGNDYEIDLLKSKTSLSEEDLLKEVDVLITTLGAKGSIIKTKDDNLEIKVGIAKQVVDPTGAGDAYRGGFLAGFLKDLSLLTCGQMGSTASCYAVEKYGTTSHSFSVEEFEKRYQENFGEALNLNG